LENVSAANWNKTSVQIFESSARPQWRSGATSLLRFEVAPLLKIRFHIGSS
jgi:hypothetical protein